MQEWVLVAGAASGIGRATTRELHQAGFKLVLADWNKAGLELLKSELTDVMTYEADVTNAEQVKLLTAFIIEKGIVLNGLIDTIGKAITLPLKSMKAEIYEDIFQVNVYSFHLLVSEIVAEGLLKLDGASVVVISSLTAEAGAKGKIAYGASKGALNSLVKSMAQELSTAGIRVNAINPGTVRSEMLDRLESNIGSENIGLIEKEYPLGFGSPQDVAAFAVYLVSSASGWMSGSVITIDGGYCIK
jgi:NAD(P)-dependent dehydrogenase (short-subunit alcohol dehydrogenase family)